MKPFAMCAALLTVAAGTVASGDAFAEITRQNATGMCQGALPAFDTQIRKRPLAVRNEGTAPAFVSCSLAGTQGEVHESVEIVFTNSGATDAVVNCTVVSGRATFSTPPQYYPQPELALPASGSDSVVYEFDNAVDPANLVNASCMLPPGVSLDYIRHDSVDPV